MEKEPLVSVVMNCYNGERYLKEAIDSVYLQTYQNWEIIFWDNASTDRSAEIALSYDAERLKYYSSSHTTSLGEARNLALGRVTGKYIAFLDCDDRYLPEKLAKQVLLMESTQYVFCYGSVIIIDDQGREKRKSPVKNCSGELFGKLLMRYEINMQTVMLLTSYISREMITFDCNLKYAPDYDLFMKIASNESVGVIKEYLSEYRVHSGSLSKTTLSIVADENSYVLRSIVEHHPEFENIYNKPIKFARKKIEYYRAIGFISQEDFGSAKITLTPIIFSSPKFFVLYILVLFRIKKELILSLLMR